MKRSDMRIHHTELLLTLDYLLNYTDEDHPATQQDICKHATNYGLVYKGGQAGDDVKRQRIGECLKFLKEVTDKFVDSAPFILQTTDSNKYYIEQKTYLNEEQVIKVLAAVQNDKYTQDEDTDELINILLDSLSNRYNRNHYLEELKKLNKGVRKYSFSTNRKNRLVHKAYNEGKMIKIRWEIYDVNRVDIHINDFWYRVYKIKEYRNKPYAILLPISLGDIIPAPSHGAIIFNEIENLNIPKELDRYVLMDDFDKKRDLNELFARYNKSDYKYYGTIDKMLEANILPEGGFARKISFYFHLGVEQFVTQTFEEFFSKKLDYVKCPSFDVKEIKEEKSVPLPKKVEEDAIIPHPITKDAPAQYGVANIIVNVRAFQSWMFVDPHGDGYVNMGDLITVVAPSSVNKYMAYFYSRHLLQYSNYQSDKQRKEIMDKLNK